MNIPNNPVPRGSGDHRSSIIDTNYDVGELFVSITRTSHKHAHHPEQRHNAPPHRVLSASVVK